MWILFGQNESSSLDFIWLKTVYVDMRKISFKPKKKNQRLYLLYWLFYLFIKLFHNEEEYFVTFVLKSDCYEKILTNMVTNVKMNFSACLEHKSSVIASCLHY